MAITTNRNIFLGVHITPTLKLALTAEVNRQRKSGGVPEHTITQSSVTYQLLRQALIDAGYPELERDEVY